ncbi:hypothetical protein [Lysinibacillus sp. NPDC093692]|uniref:hypothetical protein n=1 Tax=Lysinibacillus sp. NPDC093692 TaxID=3390578 RepID=UPI003D0282A5
MEIKNASHMPHENLMEALLATDLVTLEDHYEPKKKVFQGKVHFQGATGFDYEEEQGLLNSSFSEVDFEMVNQIEVARLKKEGKLDNSKGEKGSRVLITNKS